MRIPIAGLLPVFLIAACTEEPPVNLSAITDLQFAAGVVDSTHTYALGLTVTNVGQATVHFDGPSCAVYAVIRDAPQGAIIMPNDPPGPYPGPVCSGSSVTFDLEPGESRTWDPIYIPMYDGLVPQLTEQPHWYQVEIAVGLTDAIEEPQFVDIGWVQMTLPDYWDTFP